MKLTIKQETFCQLYVETGNASEAYRGAYNAQRMKNETVWRSASELMDNPKVSARIEQLKEEHRKRHQVTVDSLMFELQEAFDLAKDLVQPNVMIQATMSKAKLAGLDKQVIEHLDPTGAFSRPTKIELVAPSESTD